MIKRSILAVIVVLFVCSLFAQEKKKLLWKLKKDDVLGLNIKSKTRTVSKTKLEISPNEQVEEEIATENNVLELTVLDELANGNYKISMRFLKYEKKQEEKAKNTFMKAWRDKKGEVKSEVKIDSQSPVFQNQEVLDLYKDIVDEIMNVVITIELAPNGKIISSKINGNPLDRVKGGTQLRDLVLVIVKKIISGEEIATSISNELFNQLPDDAVTRGDSWNTSKEWKMVGIDAKGKGTA